MFAHLLVAGVQIIERGIMIRMLVVIGFEMIDRRRVLPVLV
jgi:hypothetical protein